jgi:hypothetical protein
MCRRYESRQIRLGSGVADDQKRLGRYLRQLPGENLETRGFVPGRQRQLKCCAG